MKKRMFILFLALFIGSQLTIPAQAESMEEVTEEASQETERELTEEEQIIEKLYDGDILETAFIGKSFWYDEENFEGMREDLPQAINDLYDQDAGDSVLCLAFDILGEGELYITVLESILSPLQNVVYLT